MSKSNTAEEICMEAVFRAYRREGIDVGDEATYVPPNWVIDAMQEHTAQTLDRLRDVAETEYSKADHFVNGDGTKDDHFWRGRRNQAERFIELIEEVSDE